MSEIHGQTNVLSFRWGSGSIDGLGRELGRFVAATMEIPWQLVRDRLGATPAAVLLVESMERDLLEQQLAKMPDCDTILAVGGGQALDLGKYLAWRSGCRLVSVPTIISVDAFVTPKAAVRHQHRVEYVGHASPDPLVIDYDLIRTVPPALNIAGVGDILSIHTATFDWELAHRAGRDEYQFSSNDVARAREMLATVDQLSGEIRSVTDTGLRAIVDGYLRINTICLPVDHYRTEEGSEHYLFYELEERLARSFIHGHIVGLGIYILSRLQQNKSDWITAIMDRVGLSYHPADMQIQRSALVDSLRSLKTFVRARNLWHTIIDEAEITDEWIEQTLSGLRFAPE